MVLQGKIIMQYKCQSFLQSQKKNLQLAMYLFTTEVFWIRSSHYSSCLVKATLNMYIGMKPFLQKQFYF